MADVQSMPCPECGHVNAMTGVVDDVRQYVCRRCGEAYYTPNDCFRESAPFDSDQRTDPGGGDNPSDKH